MLSHQGVDQLTFNSTELAELQDDLELQDDGQLSPHKAVNYSCRVSA